jgi:DNA uptake protein ComE-like DNA-binding protein
MYLEQQRSQTYVAEVRARQLAEREIWATIGELQAALANGETPAVGGPEEQLLPVYRKVVDGVPDEWSRRDGQVMVSVADESAKLNINHASPRVLQAMLGVGGEKARAIRSSVPRPGEAPARNQHWFTSTDGLVARGFLTREALRQIEPARGALLTAHSVADNRNPKGYINVNTAPKAVLAALFNAQTADRIVTARAQAPLKDFAGVIQASQAEPAAFNLDVPADGGAPADIAFESRSFRITCKASFRRAGDTLAATRVEAVVVFTDTGEAEITYWKEMPALSSGDEGPEAGSDTQQAVAES